MKRPEQLKRFRTQGRKQWKWWWFSKQTTPHFSKLKKKKTPNAASPFQRKTKPWIECNASSSTFACARTMHTEAPWKSPMTTECKKSRPSSGLWTTSLATCKVQRASATRFWWRRSGAIRSSKSSFSGKRLKHVERKTTRPAPSKSR